MLAEVPVPKTLPAIRWGLVELGERQTSEVETRLPRIEVEDLRDVSSG